MKRFFKSLDSSLQTYYAKYYIENVYRQYLSQYYFVIAWCLKHSYYVEYVDNSIEYYSKAKLLVNYHEEIDEEMDVDQAIIIVENLATLRN